MEDTSSVEFLRAQPITRSYEAGGVKLTSKVPGIVTYNLWENSSNTAKPSFLTVHHIDASGAIDSEAYPVIKKRAKQDTPSDPNILDLDAMDFRAIFDPQFSPDGRYIAFKFGYIASPGIYQLYVLDTQTQKTQLASTSVLTYYYYCWSPDSKHLAFADGGRFDPHFYDDGRHYTGELNLRICDWRTGKTQLVVSSSLLGREWNWASSDTLLFSAIDPKNEKFFLNPQRQAGIDFAQGQPTAWERLPGQAKRKPVRPNIYSYSVEKQKIQLLISDAHTPVPSADGTKVAFFGSSDDSRPFSLGKDWRHQLSSDFIAAEILSDEVNANSSSKNRFAKGFERSE